MRKSVLWSAIGVSASVVTVIIVICATFSSNPVTNTSGFPLSFFSYQKYRSTEHKFEWTEEAIGSPSKMSMKAFLECPKTSTEVVLFLSSRGGERDITGGWKAYAQSSFYFGTNKVLEPNLRISGLILGSPGPRYIRDIGGDYSLGVACTSGNIQRIESVSYRSVSIEAHTGLWTADPEPSIATH